LGVNDGEELAQDRDEWRAGDKWYCYCGNGPKWPVKSIKRKKEDLIMHTMIMV